MHLHVRGCGTHSHHWMITVMMQCGSCGHWVWLDVGWCSRLLAQHRLLHRTSSGSAADFKASHPGQELFPFKSTAKQTLRSAFVLGKAGDGYCEI